MKQTISVSMPKHAQRKENKYLKHNITIILILVKRFIDQVFVEHGTHFGTCCNGNG